MHKFKFNKLIRDKLIEKREKEGSVFNLKELNDQEFAQELRVKFLEEANEVFQAKTKEELIEELADVMQVISSICDVNKFTLQNIIDAQNKKYLERGGFEGRKYVITAEHPENSPAAKYCLADPEKYPEIK